MRGYGGSRVLSRRGLAGIAAVVALTAVASLVMACGSTPSSAGGGGGGGGSGGDAALTLSPSQARPGQVVTVRGSSLPKGEAEPIVRGDLVAETPDGEIALASINIFNQTFSQTAYVPAELAPGEYTITLKLKGEQAGKEYSAKLTVLAAQ